jgi:hypothetical protein
LMGQSAGAINVYALLTSPLVVNARPRLVHRAVPLSGGISLPTNLPPGRIPTLLPASVYLAQGNALLLNLIIADGLATDLASAQAYVASQTPAQIAEYLRAKNPATLFFTLLTKLAPLGLAGSGPIPEGTVLPLDPIAAIHAGNYLRVPVLAGNTRDEAKLFPTFLTLLGGPSGRLVTDAQLFLIQFNYDPDGAPQITIGQWIPAFYLPVTTPGTGFNARTDLLNSVFFIPSRDNVLNALSAQQADVWYYRFDWDEEPAQRHLRRRPRVRPALHLRQFRPVTVLEHRELHRHPAGSPGAVRRDDEEPGRVRGTRRSERAGSLGCLLADVAVDSPLRRDGDRQDHLGAVVRPPHRCRGCASPSGLLGRPASEPVGPPQQVPEPGSLGLLGLGGLTLWSLRRRRGR